MLARCTARSLELGCRGDLLAARTLSTFALSMRNPIRLKNLRIRFLPIFLLGGVALVIARPGLQLFGLGVGLVLLGESLRTWGAGHLLKNERLTITGPYAHLRHPLYAGTLLVASGFALIAGGIYALVLLAILLPWFFLDYFPRKDRIEGERLEQIYGESYGVYRAHVRALIPCWRPWRPPAPARELGDAGHGWSGMRFNDNNELGTLIAVVIGLALFGARVSLDP
jgi:protein-S-isoprenylcysteine O-methyltransferase Ste14